MEIYILSGLSLFILFELKCLKVALLFFFFLMLPFIQLLDTTIFKCKTLKNVLKTNVNYLFVLNVKHQPNSYLALDGII